MLVLSRHKNEVICIGNDVRITIVSIQGNKVRVGIDAPGNVVVHREEVFEEIRRESQRGSEGEQE